jgi:putative ABC transport system permease protein
VVGVAITGLTIYNATVEKSREYGILKAIGFTNGYLFRLVLEQSLVTGLLGFIIGMLATFLATRFVGGLVPQFVTLVRWQDVVLVLIATVFMSTLAALLPLRRLVSVDPVAVFAG